MAKLDPDVTAYHANIARACEAVDPAMVAYVERHYERADELSEREVPKLHLEQEVACYSPEPAPRVGIVPPSYYEQPHWIGEALAQQNTPQAVLRDLSRPVHDFSNVAMELTEFHSDITGQERRRVTRDLMATRYQADIKGISLAWAESRAGLAELFELLSAPWEDSKPATPMPRPSKFGPSWDNARWFGDES